MDGARRIFLGLPVAADTAHELHRWATRAVAETRLRVVPAANLHATLVFCGLLDDEQIDEVIAIVREETPVDPKTITAIVAKR